MRVARASVLFPAALVWAASLGLAAFPPELPAGERCAWLYEHCAMRGEETRDGLRFHATHATLRPLAGGDPDQGRQRFALAGRDQPEGALDLTFGPVAEVPGYFPELQAILPAGTTLGLTLPPGAEALGGQEAATLGEGLQMAMVLLVPPGQARGVACLLPPADPAHTGALGALLQESGFHELQTAPAPVRGRVWVHGLSPAGRDNRATRPLPPCRPLAAVPDRTQPFGPNSWSRSAVLNAWAKANLAYPYPSVEVRDLLARHAHLSLAQVDVWLINWRGRRWPEVASRLGYILSDEGGTRHLVSVAAGAAAASAAVPAERDPMAAPLTPAAVPPRGKRNNPDPAKPEPKRRRQGSDSPSGWTPGASAAEGDRP